MGFRDERDEERARAAREALARVAGEGEIFASSGLSPTGGPVAGAAARSEPEHDPVEIWGKRIGRGLGIAFALGLVVHLVTTHGIK
jgi:hypothetical protein